VCHMQQAVPVDVGHARRGALQKVRGALRQQWSKLVPVTPSKRAACLHNNASSKAND
jgi:hypothetical protein